MSPCSRSATCASSCPSSDALQPVIQDVTLGVAEGEAVGLVGESGAGKSMTSRAVIRLLPPRAVVERRDRLRRPLRARHGARRSAALPRRRRRDDLPGPAHPREPGAPHRRLPDRGARDQRRLRPRRGVGARRRAAAGRGHRRRAPPPAPVPARALRRPAAARHDRLGAGDRATSAARRRAHDLARRHDAGRGHGDPRRPAPAAEARHAVRHPRPRAGGRGLRPHRRAVRRLPRRGPRRPPTLHDTARHPYTAGLLASRPSPTAARAATLGDPGPAAVGLRGRARAARSRRAARS